MTNEIHPAVEANNVQKRRTVKAEEEKARLTVRQRKATVRFLLRELVLVCIIALSWVAMDTKLIDWRVTFSVTFLVMFIMGKHLGEWWQFVAPKEV